MNEHTEYYPPWKRTILRILEKHKPGDVISNTWLDQEMELQWPKLATPDEMRAFQFQRLAARESMRQRLLIDHRVYLETIRGVGMRWVYPHEQTQIVMARKDSELAKAFNRAKDGLSFVDYESLDDEAMRRNRDALAKVAAAGTFLRLGAESLPPKPQQIEELSDDFPTDI